MKRIAITIIILFTLLMSCEQLYISTVDIKTGQFITVRDGNHRTKINDTLLIYEDDKGFYLYGKYKDTIPYNSKSFKIVTRIK